jgi:drug/metabolite transporter (DMT)-like permease
MTTTTLGFGAMFLAGGIVPPGIATVISNAQPLIAAPIASAMLGERVKGAGVALLTGFTGIVLISVPSMTTSGSRINLYGTGLVLLAALGAAIGNVGMKALAGKVDPVMATGAQLLIGAAPLQALSLVLERDVRTAWSGTFLVSMASLALLGTGLAFLLWFKLLERVELNKLNTFTFLAPVAALALSAWMYGERLGLMESAGVALVLVAVAISTGTFRLWIAGRSSQERAR